ncbi:MAG: GDP-4-dehydro-6-deoxy-D-mannose reductase [Acidimicrobiaceae bacterium]|jgi:GDP-4-dehydro-6-deoxy-D-mannose reductase
MVRALVTGVSGFVGRHLIEHLRAMGDEVEGCDRADGSVDIGDLSSVRSVVNRVRPEVVYHLAGWSDVGGSWAAPVEVFRANAEGTLNVLLACADAGVERVLAVSSADVYGIVREDELPITEDAALRPVTPYAASKVAADYLALQAWLGTGLPVLRARAFNHLGPGQMPRFVAPALAERIARNELDGGTVVPIGNLSARRDFTDVRDVVRAYRLLVERGEPGEAYNVCSGNAVSVQQLAEALLTMAREPMELRPDPALERPIDVPVLLGDYSRLREATGWEPEIPLAQTLADLLDDMRERVRSLSIDAS